MWPGPPPRKQGFWHRRTPLQRAGLIVAALILPCCGGLTAIATFTDTKPDTVTGTSDNLADIQPITTTPPAGSPSQEPTEAAPTAPTTAPSTPTAVKKTTVTTTKVPYKTRRVDDDSLAEGKTRVRTRGVNGIKTITYEITTVDGQQTARRVLTTTITKKPITKVIAVGTKSVPTNKCDPNYTPCVPIASDVDCAGGSGNGPAYVDGPVTVVGSDIYKLDRDGDGTACDT
ncbi:G5 domain-containing protein [Paractinoplanes maris]|uniref:G5 domain-containing protein n=1 Tax=Paractinoplanes maris TaxID=1734446 RepID=UPI0020200337|nr:G5 domain-containing protein [Actinoplanes maris]